MAATRLPLLGSTIRDARKRLGLTGEQVRDLCGVDPTSLSMWERGERIPPLDRIEPLARALRLKPEKLASLALAALRHRANLPGSDSTHHS
jgi:transcriptional regulator with XRE-family HTH domain